MGKSSRRKARTQQPAPPEAAVSETSGGSQLYTFTPLKLFGSGLLLLGIGFAFGVLVQASLTPSAAPAAPARAATPAQTAAPQLPSFAELQAIDGLKEHLAHDPEDLDTRLRLGHALFANAFIEAINGEWGEDIPLLNPDDYLPAYDENVWQRSIDAVRRVKQMYLPGKSE